MHCHLMLQDADEGLGRKQFRVKKWHLHHRVNGGNSELNAKLVLGLNDYKFTMRNLPVT